MFIVLKKAAMLTKQETAIGLHEWILLGDLSPTRLNSRICMTEFLQYNKSSIRKHPKGITCLAVFHKRFRAFFSQTFPQFPTRHFLTLRIWFKEEELWKFGEGRHECCSSFKPRPWRSERWCAWRPSRGIWEVCKSVTWIPIQCLWPEIWRLWTFFATICFGVSLVAAAGIHC